MRVTNDHGYVFCLSLHWLALVLILCDSFIKAVRKLIILYRCTFLVFDEFFTLFCRCSYSNCSVSLVTKAQKCICCKEIHRCEEVMEEAIGDRTICITLHPGFESVCLRAHDCKYRESLARLKKSKILIICLENPFREIHSKKIFQSLKNQMFPRKWGKTKIRVFT